MRFRRLKSTERVEQLLLLRTIQQCFAEYFARQDAAFATLAANAQSVANVFKGIRTVGDSGADLRVGDAFTKTDVHGSY